MLSIYSDVGIVLLLVHACPPAGDKLTGSARPTAVGANEKTTKEGQVEQASSKEEYRDLHVTAVTMISDTCTK